MNVGSPLETTQITLTLPKEDVEFLQRYADRLQLSPSEAIGRFLRTLQWKRVPSPHPAVVRVSSVKPNDSDEESREAYHEKLLAKHQ